MANESMKVASAAEMELIIPEGKETVKKGTVMEDVQTSEEVRKENAGN